MNAFATTLTRQALACLACLVAGAQPRAGEFVVSPIRLELGAAVRSGVILVRNDGTERLNFQIEGSEWTQDAEGKDQYKDTRELIFFPKLMSVEPGEDGVVRVGARNLVLPSEKTYRVFIEELPGPPEARSDGKTASINVLIRFGAPIFVAPMKPEDSADIAKVEMSKGVLKLTVKNTGNRHQVVEGIRLSGANEAGKEVYALTLADRYLLAGTTKSYSTMIAPDLCTRIATLTIELKTDKAAANRRLDLTRAMCS